MLWSACVHCSCRSPVRRQASCDLRQQQRGHSTWAGGCWAAGEVGAGGRRGVLGCPRSRMLGPSPEEISRVRTHVASHMLCPAGSCTPARQRRLNTAPWCTGRSGCTACWCTASFGRAHASSSTAAGRKAHSVLDARDMHSWRTPHLPGRNQHAAAVHHHQRVLQRLWHVLHQLIAAAVGALLRSTRQTLAYVSTRCHTAPHLCRKLWSLPR